MTESAQTMEVLPNAEDSPSRVPHAQPETPAAPNRGGAPRGNQNNMRHGLKAATLPRDCRYIENALNHFREQLEAATVQAHSLIDVTKAGLIQSAVRHEKAASLAERWLRIEKSLTLQDRLQLLAGISRATDSRDRCLKELNLDRHVAGDLNQWLHTARLAGPTTDGDAA